MRTKVKVIVKLEIEHEENMPIDELESLARQTIHNSKINGASIHYGSYRVKEIGRSIEI